MACTLKSLRLTGLQIHDFLGSICLVGKHNHVVCDRGLQIANVLLLGYLLETLNVIGSVYVTLLDDYIVLSSQIGIQLGTLKVNEA
jgi:hypothetical protein